MYKLESEIMSLPSDILSQEDQALIFRDIGDVNNVMATIFYEDSQIVNQNTYNGDEDYKENLPLLEMPDTTDQVLPPIVQNILSNEEYPGPYEFDVDIHPDGSKNPWVYSPALNKIYMDMSSPFPVDFKIKNRPHNSLYIRTTPVYALPQHSQEFVYRCINHEHPMENSNLNVKENVRPHIIRCTNSNAIYLGDKNKNQRLSVVIPFSHPQTGTDSVREMFLFVCKNSCPTPGMSRRPIEVIFTLEDINGQILGRRVLSVRICSCPKRDKEKEEKEYNMDKLPLPRGKKRKLDKSERKVLNTENDTKEYTLQLKLVGKHNLQQVLKYCHDLMAGEILRHPSNGTDNPYKKCYNEIAAIMGKPLE